MVDEIVGDPRFFRRVGPHDLATIAALAEAEIRGTGAATLHGVAPLQAAEAGDISFLDNRRYADLLTGTRAGAVILHPALAERLPPGCVGLLTREPYLAWARVCTLFFPRPATRPGRHASAVIDPGARIDPTAEIGPFAVIGEGASIGPGCRIEAHAVIGDGVEMGTDCVIGANASLSHALLGDRVRLYPGARIGQDGFGFAPDGRGGYLTVPQLGRVILESDVEVGANTTIDRGSMRDTVIGAGSRLDNLVQIGHNVRLGRGCVIVAQVGISGSTIARGPRHGGRSSRAYVGHLHIGQQRAHRCPGRRDGRCCRPAAASWAAPASRRRQYFRELAAHCGARRQAGLRRPAGPALPGNPMRFRYPRRCQDSPGAARFQ